MPVKLLTLLQTHKDIDQFEAEFAIFVTDQKRLNFPSSTPPDKDKEYDIIDILKFIMKKKQNAEKSQKIDTVKILANLEK